MTGSGIQDWYAEEYSVLKNSSESGVKKRRLFNR